MKKIFVISLTVFLALGLVTGCSCEKKEENKNTNNGVLNNENANVTIKDRKVKGLDVIDFLVVYEDEISDIYFTIQNNTDATVTYSEVECSLYDKNKELLYSFKDSVGTLESLDEKNITHRVNLDLTKVAEVEYVLR